MFIRRTQTRSRLHGEAYFTHRLVRSERVGGRVRQVTLLNLGRHFELAAEQWPLFCQRLSELLSTQPALTPVAMSAEVEAAAQRYAALIQPHSAGGVGSVRGKRGRQGESGMPLAAPAVGPEGHAENDVLDLRMPEAATATAPVATAQDRALTPVDLDSLVLLDPRSVGVEALALQAIEALGITETLAVSGMNRVSLAAAVGQIVARMAHPASERATLRWLQRDSALGELWGYDYGRMSLNRLYQVADALWARHAQVEAAVYGRIEAVFGGGDTVALYDLTNTYFEGVARTGTLRRRGHSKEKRSDAPLVTLGLVLDGRGFVRRSQVFAGNLREHTSLKGMLAGLGAPTGACVVLDRGLVTADNLVWLREHQYRYLVMCRERRQIVGGQTLTTASEQDITWQRIVADDGDVRLICHSAARAEKEAAMTALHRNRFESKLGAIAEGLVRSRTDKRPARIHQRIGRLREAHASVAQHYQITVDSIGEGDAAQVTAIRFTWAPTPNSKAERPGHYVIRSNDPDLDGAELWRRYIQLTDLEAVFRSLKSELGLRPIHHRLDRRTQAHLWISVLAYQCVQYLRRRLKDHGCHFSWESLRRTLASQRRITATFRTANNATLHVRKTTQANAEQQAIYRWLGLHPQPGGIQRRTFDRSAL